MTNPQPQAGKETSDSVSIQSKNARSPRDEMASLSATLRQSEERYRTLFDLSPVAVYSIDAGGVIREFNRHAAELWGRVPVVGDTDQRFCGSYRMFLPDGTHLPHHRCPMATVASGEVAEARNAEVVIERPDGSCVTVIVNIVPLKNERGEITGAINCFYDISERSRLESKTKEQAQALADLDRRKDEFLAMLSHELRNPLAPIVNGVQILKLDKSQDPRQRQVLGIIEHQVSQLVRVVDDLLELSRITSGKIVLSTEWVSIADVVERAVEATRPLMVQHRHKLAVSLPPDPVRLRADPVRLEQVVVNLLANAAKYTGEGGNVWLTVEQTGRMIELQVRDSGIGIPADLLPNVFDLFTQGDRSLDRSKGGLGIGLALVKRLVDLHGGSVQVTSVIGQGSRFVVRMPVNSASSTPSSPSPTKVPSQTTKGCRVLVVDDNADAAQTLRMLLEQAAHEVRVANDGRKVLETILDFRPQLVLLDIGLPGLDGFQVAKSIRQEPMLKGILLVAITGYGRESDRLRSSEAGFDHHLVKPAKFSEVEAILAAI